ncbi:DUF2309 domain-containing protein [Hydrogenobaculum acidophilum]
MIQTYLNNVKKYIPHYWPMTTFVHHNPLHGFEDMPFKEALKKASKLYKAKVYMESSYYTELYKEGAIKKDVLEKNLFEFLKSISLEKYFPEAKKFITELSQDWKHYKIKSSQKPDVNLMEYFNQKIIKKEEVLFEELIEDMLFCEILDALFEANITDIIEKEIVEFVARFLDEGQTTMSMPEREKGMFEAFKYYEGLNTILNAEEYADTIIHEISPKNIEQYILRHLIKDFGWAAFIRYREDNKDYYFQQIHPASLLDYIAIRLHYESKYVKDSYIVNFSELYNAFSKNKTLFVLKLLKAKNILPSKYIDRLENKENLNLILTDYLVEEVILEACRIQNIANELLLNLDRQKDIVEFAYLIERLKEEEGYIWLKSLEDSYIKEYTIDFLQSHERISKDILASAVFCIDVRSEAIRRHIERLGNYNTFGVAGFFGTPIAYVEFDKAHELNLCPVFIKPSKIIFELPEGEHYDYKTKHNINHTFKKILDSLKNNPYTPFFMVEAMGWLFGINLFGKTLFPDFTLKILSFIKAKKPNTQFTIDSLTEEEINFYAEKFFIQKIKEAYHLEFKKSINDKKAKEILEIMLNDKVSNIDNKVLEILSTKYNITKESFEFEKQRLSNVGYTKEEQVNLVENFLRLIGLTENIPKFVLLIAHVSSSDNNPFESALDCGACGGNSGLPNVRILANIANRDYVRKELLKRGISIPPDTIFVPGLHNTTTDDITFYDTEAIPAKDKILFEKIEKDFKIASQKTREERAKTLPYAGSGDRISIRAIDWSETRPEWGLSRNMGVYVGKRSSTQNITLKNRFFMQSYDWEIDKDNKILKTILSGPFIIGEWINMEHYFSTTDNERLGAGSKVYHNVVGKIGVWTGNYGDLRTGLPYQTVYHDGIPYHEPIRLLTFIEAPVEKVLEAAQQTEEALKLVVNEWVRLIIIDKVKGIAYTFKDGNLEVLLDSRGINQFVI